MRESLSAQPRRRRYRLYNPNDDPEFDPELGSTNNLGAEDRGLEERPGDIGDSRALEESRALEDSGLAPRAYLAGNWRVAVSIVKNSNGF